MDDFIGTIRIFAFDYAPRYWLKCDGQSLSIPDYVELFSIIGTKYGGDGRRNFNLPDLRGRVAVQPDGNKQGPFFENGSKGGEEMLSLEEKHLPTHSHKVGAFARTSSAQIQLLNSVPGSNCFLSGGYSKGASRQVFMYTDKTDQPVQLNIETIGPWPDHGKPHENRMPYMVLNYCICVKGIFPMR